MHDAQDSKLSSIPTTARCPNFIKFKLSIELKKENSFREHESACVDFSGISSQNIRSFSGVGFESIFLCVQMH